MKITARCRVTNEKYSVTVPDDEYERWMSGMLIQDAMPTLSKEDREFLISGISPKGWWELFGVDTLFEEIRELIAQGTKVAVGREMVNDTLRQVMEEAIGQKSYVEVAALAIIAELKRRKP